MTVDVIFLAYRDWSLKVFPAIQKHPKVEKCVLCTTVEQLQKLALPEYDLLITCGWSDEIGAELSSRMLAIGVHCAELDRYSYGTPLQNQIMDGVKYTKHRVFKFTYDDKSPRTHTHSREYSHEVALDLSGNMEDVLVQMTSTSIVLFNMFLDDYPNICWNQWPEEPERRTKRTPQDSKLSKEDVVHMTTEQLYNFMRCLEHPYPNAYLEDETGRLYFERVRFKRKPLLSAKSPVVGHAPLGQPAT